MKHLNKSILQNWNDLSEFFQGNTPYGNFILECLSKKYPKGTLFENHHIQPRHMGGLDRSWNIVTLSYKDHGKAHELLYKEYHVPYDKAVAKMRFDVSPNVRALISKANVEIAREKGIGRFSSALQSELGQRPKKERKPTSRTSDTKAALSRGMIWAHEDGTRCTIFPNQLESPAQIAELLSFKCSEKLRAGLKEKGSKSYLSTGIIRILNGTRDKKTNKALYSIGPWRLEGILIG